VSQNIVFIRESEKKSQDFVLTAVLVAAWRYLPHGFSGMRKFFPFRYKKMCKSY